MPTPRLKLRVGISCFLNFIGGGNACYLENVARIDAYFIMPKGIPNKRYTGEFKQMVVETMIREKLNYIETRKRFDIAGEDRVRGWERIYLTEGPEGLYVERRGRASTGRPRKLPKETEEDLLAEVQRLRAENAYLKKLQALVMEEERHQSKK